MADIIQLYGSQRFQTKKFAAPPNEDDDNMNDASLILGVVIFGIVGLAIYLAFQE